LDDGAKHCVIEFCVRLGKSGSKTLQLIHQAYGDNAMIQAVVFKWWKCFRDGETNVKEDQEVKTACFTVLLKLSANSLQHVFEKWMEHCKKCITCQGRYFEKETITTSPQSSDSE
jgi:hypothetical protein